MIIENFTVNCIANFLFDLCEFLRQLDGDCLDVVWAEPSLKKGKVKGNLSFLFLNESIYYRGQCLITTSVNKKVN